MSKHLTVGLIFALVTSAVASPPQLVPSERALGDEFGAAVAVSGQRAVVGAPGLNDEAGAVFVFAFYGEAWSQTAQLTASNGAAGDLFGLSVAIDGDTIVVGAPGADAAATDAGAIYVFEDEGGKFSETAVLTPGDAVGRDFLGSAVDVLGDRLIGGAPRDSVHPAGTLFVFERVAGVWTFSESLTRDTPTTKGVATDLNNFGMAISLGPDRIAVGAPEDDNRRGVVYLFDRVNETWRRTQRIAPGFGDDGDRFGASVSLSGDRLLVGVPGANNRAGLAEVMEFNGTAWGFAYSPLRAEDSTEVTTGNCADQLGTAVSLDGDFALVGAATDAVWGPFAGSIYLYQLWDDNWDRVRKLTEEQGAANRLFGQAVALSGGLALAGSPAVGRGAGACSPATTTQAGRTAAPRLYNDPALGVQPDEFEPDNSLPEASDIQVGMQFRVDEFPQRHTLQPAEDVDYIRFLYNETSNYTIRAQPRDATLAVGVVLEDAQGVELDSAGCDGGGNAGFDVNVFPPNGLADEQLLYARAFECVSGTATGSRDYDFYVAGVGHQQCVVLEGRVTTSFTGALASRVWLFSDINNTVVTSDEGTFSLCADYDIRELTTFDPSGATLPATIDVLATVSCAPDCIEPDYEDDDGFIRPRIQPGTRTTLDFSVPGPVIFQNGFEP